jgi:chemotaxis protein CheX
MNVQYINPFLLATIATFDTMFRCVLTREDPYIKTSDQPSHEVSGIIGLSGKAQGTVVVGLDREVAMKVAEIMLQERPADINSEVIDAVGELANIIAGGGKRHLTGMEMSVSLPTVITGKHHCIQFPSKIIPICIPFRSEWGPVTVEVGISELTPNP